MCRHSRRRLFQLFQRLLLSIWSSLAAVVVRLTAAVVVLAV